MASSTSLASLEGEMKGVDTSIKKLESQIVEVEEKLSEPGISEEEKQRLRKKEDYLRKEKEQLCKEKEQLRKKEEQLREEKLLRLKEEERLAAAGAGTSSAAAGPPLKVLLSEAPQLHPHSCTSSSGTTTGEGVRAWEIRYKGEEAIQLYLLVQLINKWAIVRLKLSRLGRGSGGLSCLILSGLIKYGASALLRSLLRKLVLWAKNTNVPVEEATWSEAQQLVAAPPSLVTYSDFGKAIIGFFDGIKVSVLVLFDELQSFLQPTVNSDLDKPGAEYIRDVLKQLLGSSPNYVLWCVTSSSMALMWLSIAAMPTYGFTLMTKAMQAQKEWKLGLAGLSDKQRSVVLDLAFTGVGADISFLDSGLQCFLMPHLQRIDSGRFYFKDQYQAQLLQMIINIDGRLRTRWDHLECSATLTQLDWGWQLLRLGEVADFLFGARSRWEDRPPGSDGLKTELQVLGSEYNSGDQNWYSKHNAWLQTHLDYLVFFLRSGSAAMR
ncbi:hypothetical protein GPECTOR_241g583 [Gonium pectorale]|uniref:Uncharacterized protein n=1 Tax=Gonium pectorale TaxID=33097 RepID=A0A150FY29_GONPE|nr:hypothetical protein GPECTOR_241g583 [Gonium pectorale]|eukprot:KXZ41930.1 hypothetical protein GPECTOR_241g583 [Gonium pectorale]